ncbi:MAG TPA: 6-phosphofructokinase, partial [Candidatus Cloacimonadota bacterium]|nr:6-phosphofructokinase [Candidatus Cloacimonadota bacterium]
MNLQGKVVIAQGGGPTAVINQSLVGAILESKKFSQITKIYGAVGGIRGIINEDFLDLSQETTHNLEQVAISASSALLSTRDKPDDDYCTEAFHVMKAHDVRYFFYIGGND